MTRIHLIGIGGTGLSAIARILLETGYAVSGSDRAESAFTQDLRSAGATIQIGHRAENIAGADLVVRSSAIPDDNPEVVAALAAGIQVLKRSDSWRRLMEDKVTIAVAGTHGKTTTTAMIAWMLTALDLDPSFISGGVLSNLGVNARAGKGDHFVIEADEYDRMFLGLKPHIASRDQYGTRPSRLLSHPRGLQGCLRRIRQAAAGGRNTDRVCRGKPGPIR